MSILAVILLAVFGQGLISFTATGQRDFFESMRRVREALLDWRGFWKYWMAKGDLARIQTAWFLAGGPDNRPLASITVKMRARGLRQTKRNSSNFYLALKDGNADNPDLNVAARGPRNVWTKNTLRSTYLDPILEPDKFEIRPNDFRRQHQRTYYKRFISKRGRPDGTFADGLNPLRIWDTRSMAVSITYHLQRFFADLANPRQRRIAA